MKAILIRFSSAFFFSFFFFFLWGGGLKKIYDSFTILHSRKGKDQQVSVKWNAIESRTI